jgi:hypothetical protein
MRSQQTILKHYLQPAFVCCVGVLVLSSAGMSVMIKALGGYLVKEPMLLRKSFSSLDEESIRPYRIVSRHRIENKDILESLGTEDYIQWVLEDPELPERLGANAVMLFLTYYRLPDRVPHVPEECYMGGGFQRLATHSLSIPIDSGGTSVRVPARYLAFGGTDTSLGGQESRVPVVYLFRVNGQYAGNRDEARMILNKNLFGKSSYFSKIELVFNQGGPSLTREQTVAQATRLFNALLPVLEREYWPLWDKP